MTIRLSATSGGGGAGFKLAPDLNYISNNISSNQPFQRVTNIDGSSGFVTALSLAGKFAVPMLRFGDTLAESMSVRLTIDGTIIINDTFTATTNGITVVGGDTGAFGSVDFYEGITPVCNSSLLLEIQTTTDTDVTLQYIARPIL